MDRIVPAAIQFRWRNDSISFKEPLKIVLLKKNIFCYINKW